MKYREFINSMSNDDFADMIFDDTVLNMACVENLTGEDNRCPYNHNKCKKCVMDFLDSEMEVELIK